VTELQQNRYDQLLRRVGDLKGPGSKVNDVLQELFPTIDVENVPGELLLLMGTRIGWAATSTTPAAGKKAGIQLFNPAGSGQLIVVSNTIVSSSLATNINWGTTTLALATNTGIPKLRDTRNEGGSRGVSQLRTSTDQVSPTSGSLKIVANVPFSLTDRNSFCVLSPGTGITIGAGPDTNFAVTFFYRERTAEPSELTL